MRANHLDCATRRELRECLSLSSFNQNRIQISILAGGGERAQTLSFSHSIRLLNQTNKQSGEMKEDFTCFVVSLLYDRRRRRWRRYWAASKIPTEAQLDLISSSNAPAAGPHDTSDNGSHGGLAGRGSGLLLAHAVQAHSFLVVPADRMGGKAIRGLPPPSNRRNLFPPPLPLLSPSINLDNDELG